MMKFQCTRDCGAAFHMTGGRHRLDCPASALDVGFDIYMELTCEVLRFSNPERHTLENLRARGQEEVEALQAYLENDPTAIKGPNERLVLEVIGQMKGTESVPLGKSGFDKEKTR